jgi:branched-subunit amino acid transport protein
MTFWLTVALCAVGTFLTRATPLFVSARPPASAALRRYVDALPTAVIAALAGAATIAPQDTLTRGPEPLAAAVAALVALWRRNLLLAVIAGIGTIALLRGVGIGTF